MTSRKGQERIALLHLFQTKGGRLCILLDREVPLLIRPQGQQYVIVSSCYVSKAMRGDFMKDVETGKRCIETIALI